MKKMKKLKLLLGVAVMSIMLSVPMPVNASQLPTAQTIYTESATSTMKVKNGLVIEGNKITYWVKGRQVKNCWKKWKGHRYYFKDNGYAAKGGIRINDRTYVLDENGRQITDKTNRMVKVKDNLYYITSQYGRAATGYFVYKNNLYYADAKGRCYKNRSRENGRIQFGSNGKAKQNTDALLKMKTMDIVSRITNSSMTKSQKLRACWNYVVGGNIRYWSVYPNLSVNGWQRSLALSTLSNGGGNCYGFACAFSALAQEVGYEPYVVYGYVPGTRDGGSMTRHCWVQIGGLSYDPEGQYAGWARGIYGTYGYGVYHWTSGSVKFA